MQICVIGSAELATAQLRVYAEYRVFAALARFERLVERVAVTLEREGNRGQAGCVIDVYPRDSAPLRFRGTDAHIAEAIDRAADCARHALERRRLSLTG
jgi:ribosome-associated translation inhibitor RaiA